MNRRNFMRSMLGVAAATALPSEVWPFRKIFLPATSPIVIPRSPLILAAIEAIELENFAKELPNLFYYDRIAHTAFTEDGRVYSIRHATPAFRIPMRFELE